MPSFLKFNILIFTVVVFACHNPGEKNPDENASNTPQSEQEISSDNSGLSITVKEESPTDQGQKKNVNQHFRDIAPQSVKDKLAEGDKPDESYLNMPYKKTVTNSSSFNKRRQNKEEAPPEPGSGLLADPSFSGALANTPEGRNNVEAGSKEALARASQSSPKKEAETKTAPVFSHEIWDRLLKKYVTADGKVNYAGLKPHKSELARYLGEFRNNPPQKDWPKADIMAYWINAYNANTVKVVVDNYPLRSIRDLKGGKIWDIEWIKIGEQLYSLDQIENQILRPRFKDPRIHFALNCAAKSCPPLLNRAWTGENLNHYLEQQAHNFINNSKHNNLQILHVRVSKIFEWYADDFGDIIAYIKKYSTKKISPDAKVSYLEYDWGLNKL